MARRRRSRGTWFPNIGSQIGALTENFMGRSFSIGAATNGSITTGILPLTFDTPFEGDRVSTGVDSLADIIGSEYVLMRIVGKLFASYSNPQLDGVGAPGGSPIYFTAGFFVARPNDEAVGGGEDTPIGSATEAERRDNYSPLEVDTVREPWIWRRSWILGVAGGRTSVSSAVSPQAAFSNPNLAAYPQSTALYGSVHDGPHFDSKVKRRVGQDDRLWFAVSTANFPFGATTVVGTTQGIITGALDYRIFGSLRKARNSSAF